MLRISGDHEFFSMDSPNTIFSHQTRHSGSGNFNALSIKFFRYPWTSISCLTCSVDSSDLRKQHAIFIMAPGGMHSLTSVIATLTNFKNFTHLPNRKFQSMILYELVNLLLLAEKMPTAFFNMSRSMVTSASSFFNLASSFSSGVSCLLPLPLNERVGLALSSLLQR